MRVSTDEQAEEGTSLEEQEEVCQAYADSHGWQVVAVFPDEYTGKVRSRPELNKLMALAEVGAFDVMIIMKLNRLARKAWVGGDIAQDLEELGVELVSIKEQMDTSTPAGRFMRTIFLAAAELDRDNIVDQTTAGLYRRASQASWPGGPPPWGMTLNGYTYKERQRIKAETGSPPVCPPPHKLDIDPEEARTIRQATDLLVDHSLTTWETAKALNGMGLLPRDAQGWTHLNLRGRLLRADYLSGTYTWGGSKDRDPVEFQVPAILTPERHEALKAVLRSTTTTGTPWPKHYLYVLSKGILLGACGRPMHGMFRNDRRAATYRCRGRQPEERNRCDCQNLSVERTERIVWSAVTDLLSQPERLVELADEYLGISTDELETEHERIARYDGKITTLTQAKTRAAAEGFKAGLDADQIRAVTAELDAELVQLKAHRDRLAVWATEKQEAADRISRLQQMAERLPVRLATMTPHERRQVLELLEVKVTVERWDDCDECDGRGKLRGAQKGMGKEAGGKTCPKCAGYRNVPRLRIEGSVMDALLDVGDDDEAGNISDQVGRRLIADLPHPVGLSWPFVVTLGVEEAVA